MSSMTGSNATDSFSSAGLVSLLFPCAFLALGGWMTGTTFVSSWYTHGIASSLSRRLQLPDGCCLYSLPTALAIRCLFLWGPEAQWDFTRWCQLGGLWAFVALHGAFGLIGFMLRQFEVARLVGIRPLQRAGFFWPDCSVCLGIPDLSLGTVWLVLCA